MHASEMFVEETGSAFEVERFSPYPFAVNTERFGVQLAEIGFSGILS